MSDAAVDTPSSVIPPRPEVSAAVRQLVERWWKQTSAIPDFEAAVHAQREAQKTLFPAWFDPTDKFKGQIPFEQRKRRDDRNVRLNIVYRNVMQTVAMTVPDDHTVEFEPLPFVGTEDGSVDPSIDMFAQTLTNQVREHTMEASFQSKIESAVQDACQYRLACIKVVYDRDFVTDTLKAQVGDSRDEQQNISMLSVLVQDYHRGVFDKGSADFERMLELAQALNLDTTSELKLWHGLRVENIPLDCIRFDSTIRDIDDIHRSKWMRHDSLMSVDDIRAKFPFRQKEDGTWDGVHPDDLAQNARNRMHDGLSDTYWSRGRQLGKGPTNRPDSKDEADRLVVAEIWSRIDNRVFVFVENVPYPVANYVPQRTPAQWYPFCFLRLNRVTGQVYGISDVELQAEIQHRINRKRSDEEKFRNLSLPRGIYNTQGIDQNEVNKLKDMPPGELRGLNLTGQTINDAVKFFNFPMTTEPFFTGKDEQDMRQMASLPEQMQGVTGNADYAAEVEAAMQGAAISANARGSIIRRWLETVYKLIGEILIQELTPDDVVLSAGPQAHWPKVHSDMDAARMMTQIKQIVDTQIEQQKIAAQASGIPLSPIDLEAASANMMQQQCIASFGMPEPMTRESLFRRLRCKVSVAINTSADRKQRIAAIQMAFAAIQSGGQAAMASGLQFDPRPLLKVFTPIAGVDLTKMFVRPPPMPMPLPGTPAGPNGAPQAGGDLPGAPPVPKQGDESLPAEGLQNNPNSPVSPVNAPGGIH